MDYFDDNYVTGKFRRIRRVPVDDGIQAVHVRWIPPLFPPQLWNVHQATMNNEARTNNLCESWNFAFQNLIGYAHPSVWTAINCMRKDQILVATVRAQGANGQPPRKRVKKATKDLQTRLKNLCIGISTGQKTLEEFLRGVGRVIRWKTRD